MSKLIDLFVDLSREAGPGVLFFWPLTAVSLALPFVILALVIRHVISGGW